MSPPGCKTANPGFDGIGKDAQGVILKEQGDIGLVIRQIVFMGVLELYVRVFQLNKHQRKSVDIEDNIRPAIVPFPPDPQLGNG